MTAIAQLGLPDPSTALAAPAVLSCASIALACWLTWQWWRADGALTAHLAAATQSGQYTALSAHSFTFYVFTVTVGGNGEQLLDGLINVDIDDAVAGGKVMAATAKVCCVSRNRFL